MRRRMSISRRGAWIGLGATALATLVTVPAGATPAHPLDQPAPPSASASKPTAADQPRITPTVVPKPKHARTGTITPLDGWTVQFDQRSYTAEPGQHLQVTAIANQDVGPTPYYISIYELGLDGTRATVATCGTGYTCSATITHSQLGSDTYYAFVSGYPNDSVNPPNLQAQAEAEGNWYFNFPALSAATYTTTVGATTTITSSTDTDIAPTIYYNRVYDATTGTLLTTCATGTSCSISVTQAQATTHEYRSYLLDSSVPAAYPPGFPQAGHSNPAFVTWAASGWQVALTGVRQADGSALVTATANRDVQPTPYYIEIFNAYDGTFLASCAGGTACTVNSGCSLGSYACQVVAFVANYDRAFIPAGTQANSNTIGTQTGV